MCQFLLGKVLQLGLRKKKRLLYKCQFLLGKVLQAEEILNQGVVGKCQFLLGKVLLVVSEGTSGELIIRARVNSS